MFKFLKNLLNNTPSNEQNKTTVFLLPKEILFLHYINNRPTDYEIAGYWNYTYQLDVDKTIDKLLKGNYLTYADTNSVVATYKVSELKDFLSKKDLQTTGKKQELVNRIFENFSIQEIEQQFTKKIYKTTESGEELLMQHDCIIYFHQHSNYFNIPIEQADRIQKANPDLTKYDIAIKIFNEKGKEYTSNGLSGPYRNTLHHKAIVYRDTNDIKQELEMLLQVCYLDLIDRNPLLAPGIITAIKDNEYYSNMAPDDLHSFFELSVKNLPSEYNKSRISICYQQLLSELEKR